MNDYLHREIAGLIEYLSVTQENAEIEEHISRQPRRRLNVYIELEEEGELPEVIVDEQTTTTTHDDIRTPLYTEESFISSGTAPHLTRRPRRTRITLLLLLGISLFGIIAGILSLIGIRAFFPPSATITIVSASQQLMTTSTLKVITNGIADPTKNQVPGRVLPSITMSQTRTVPTTGITYQNAKAAHGFITFYNAAPYVQRVNAGTLLIGADGIQLVTDQDAIIPAAIMPTEGQVTVVAHAANVGPAGDVRADDVYGQCCRQNVFVANRPFSGGQNARDFPTVTMQDLKGTVVSLENDLTKSVQIALQTQVHSEETLIMFPECNSHHTQSHDIGDEATQVTVAVNVTCTGEVYNTQALQSQIAQLAVQQARKQIGNKYVLSGEIHRSILSAHISNDTHDADTFEVKGTSVWIYQFSESQLMRIATMIAGKKKDHATRILLQRACMQRVSINVTGSDMSTLPTDSRQIHFLVLNETT